MLCLVGHVAAPGVGEVCRLRLHHVRALNRLVSDVGKFDGSLIRLFTRRTASARRARARHVQTQGDDDTTMSEPVCWLMCDG